MKKLITILSLIIVVLVGLIGCSNKTVETSETKQKDIGTFSNKSLLFIQISLFLGKYNKMICQLL